MIYQRLHTTQGTSYIITACLLRKGLILSTPISLNKNVITSHQIPDLDKLVYTKYKYQQSQKCRRTEGNGLDFYEH